MLLVCTSGSSVVRNRLHDIKGQTLQPPKSEAKPILILLKSKSGWCYVAISSWQTSGEKKAFQKALCSSHRGPGKTLKATWEVVRIGWHQNLLMSVGLLFSKGVVSFLLCEGEGSLCKNLQRSRGNDSHGKWDFLSRPTHPALWNTNLGKTVLSGKPEYIAVCFW